ncbi:hypothetical protein J2S19_000310 [Metabacillus malikii]|uniref:Uncharacterized protein n=1 Tax=Metabacillus malikii TaxID=1504265 RepID=A0ABT9Z9X3_9BACI|nr:hypothetical protein [Metabacillus malikii]
MTAIRYLKVLEVNKVRDVKIVGMLVLEEKIDTEMALKAINS